MRNTIMALLGGLWLSASGCGTPGASHSTPGDPDLTAGRSSKVSAEELKRIRFLDLWSANIGSSIEQIWFERTDLYLTSRNSKGGYQLIKVDGTSGLAEWTYDLQGRLPFPPTVFEYPRDLKATRFTEVFLVQNDHIYCLDDEVGLEVYKIKTGVSVSTPVTASVDNVFFGSWNHRVFAFGKNSRIQSWTYLTDAPIPAAPVVGKVSLYFGSEDGNVYSLNTGAGYQDGSSWIRRTGGKVVTPPIFFNDRLYCGSWDYKLYCFEEFEGLVRWAAPLGAPVMGEIFPYKETVFATTADDKKAGQVSWRLTCLNQSTGETQWERRGFRRVISSDALHCFGLGVEGKLAALRHTDGQTDWELDLSRFDFVVGQDAAQGALKDMWGRFFVATRDGFMQCLKPRK